MDIPIAQGAGTAGAGVGPAGHDPEMDPSEKVTQTPVGALFFDPYDRVWKQNSDLTMVEGSGPIQRAAVLLIPRGHIAATPGNGIDIAAIKRASPERRQRVVEDQVRAAWKPLLDSGQIEMGAVTLEEQKPGQPWSGRFYVEARDLITQKTKTLTGNT